MTNGSLLEIALWVMAYIIVYGLIARGLFRATEPVRQEMLDIAATILATNKIDAPIKRRIERSLDDVYSSWVAWKILFLMLCLIVTAPFHRFRFTPQEAKLPANLRSELYKYQIRWLIVTLANSPVAALLFGFLSLLLIAFTLSVKSLVSTLMTKRDDHEGGRAAHA